MSKNFSRREFIKGAAASAISVAALGVAGCGKEASTSGIFNAGTYSSVVKGYSSYIKVTMTFSADSITECKIDASGETPDIAGPAASEMEKLIIKNQSVDVVSGATASFTIPSIKKAAANCIAQAQGTEAALIEFDSNANSDDWLGLAPVIEESQITSTLNTDLLIVGAGNGGLMAAATAADAKMNFIICEQNTTVGDTRFWIGAVDTDAMKEAEITVQKDRILNELARYASYKCDMNVIKMWLDNSAEMISYLESLGGTSVVNIENGNHVGGNNMEYYVPSIWHTVNVPEGSPYASMFGMDRNRLLADYIFQKGYEISYSMTLIKLLQDSSNIVTGAIFTDASGKYVKINAKNVILATGGYPGNPKMIKALAPIIEKCVTSSSYFGPDTGMGIKAGIWAGAEKDTEPAPMIFDRGLVAPGVKAGYADDGNGNLKLPGTVYQFNLGTQPLLKINKEGRRFANESCPYDFFNYAASLQTDGVYAAIFDSDIVEDIKAYDQYGCAKISVDMAHGGVLMNSIEQYVNEGLIFKCDTIEELAEKLGIPSNDLAASVNRYNELCEKGVDEDYGKEAYRMRAVDNAPYYGCYFGGTLLTTCDGLRINDKCQVYDTNHKVIEGLYSIGDCSGSFFSNNYPEYFVGVAIGRTLTQGRRAIKAILGEI